jgi:hypothetical protein
MDRSIVALEDARQDLGSRTRGGQVSNGDPLNVYRLADRNSNTYRPEHRLRETAFRAITSESAVRIA